MTTANAVRAKYAPVAQRSDDDDDLQRGPYDIPYRPSTSSTSSKPLPPLPSFSSMHPAISRYLPSRFFCSLILLFFTTLFALLAIGTLNLRPPKPQDGLSPPYYPSPRGGTDPAWSTAYARAAALVAQLTLPEKVNLTTGVGWQMGFCVGNTGSVPRLGVPSLCLQDGPLGLRFADHATAWPAGLTAAATWDVALLRARGAALAREARGKGIHVLLGPVVGPLGRSPYGGRNWEGFGSDPTLQGLSAAATIVGMQGEGVQACVKHLVGNEQEHFRRPGEWGLPDALSSDMDDRTMHEMYLWPFADSVKAGVASVMCSYNMLNQSYSCGNSKVMSGLLKDELGFQGYVVSDWLAQRAGVSTALAGLDMTMPGDGLDWADRKSLWGPHLTTAVLNGSVPMERLNDMATRIVAAWYQHGQDDKERWPGDGTPNFSSWTNKSEGYFYQGSPDRVWGVVNHFVDVQDDHAKLARRIAAEGTVLVKNEGNLLPLSKDGWLPPSESRKFRVGIYGEDARASVLGPNPCVDKACMDGTLTMGWGSGAVELPSLAEPLAVLTAAFDRDRVDVAEWPENVLPPATHPLHDRDLCLVFVSAIAGEGYLAVGSIRGDRNDLYTNKAGDALVQHVARNCGRGRGKTVVVVHAVGAVLVEQWIDLPGVHAVLFAHLPGQESGNAIADVLFGAVEPSGRLPYTVAKRREDYGPGGEIVRFPNGWVPIANFSEGGDVDYRWFDRKDITPRYEFGFGLGYTTFALSDLAINLTSPRTPLPTPRPDDPLAPPDYDTTIPDPSTALAPKGMKLLRGYIYPYIASTKIEKGPYPYPDGYFDTAPRSPAGGGPGGNPDLWTQVAEVTVRVTNRGARAGATVVQVYVSLPQDYVDAETGEAVTFPVRALRGFAKVRLGEGGTAVATVGLTRRDLSYWCVRRQNWVIPDGEIRVSVGFSSRDLPVEGTL